MRTVIFIVLLGAAFAASAQLYRWTDENGRVHVTDTPPPPSAKDVRKRAIDAAPDAGSDANQPYALRIAVERHPITLYTAPNCRPCADARKLLNSRGAPFKEVSVVGQPHTEELRKLIGSLSVPALAVGASVQRGFEEGAYHTLLDSAGYPRAGVLPRRNQTEPKPAPATPEATEAPPAEESGTGRPGPYTPR
jgi:glutaredoxin